jgi:hypothetical protein
MDKDESGSKYLGWPEISFLCVNNDDELIFVDDFSYGFTLVIKYFARRMLKILCMTIEIPIK